eukprot:m.107380 g.107380  ORF g.107380 m.107380 type:complete len:106 (+) comp21145_c0_seq4:1486-1803(+)
MSHMNMHLFPPPLEILIYPNPLIRYLIDKHPATRATRLPFSGQNLAIYCTDYASTGRDLATHEIITSLQTETEHFVGPVHAEVAAVAAAIAEHGSPAHKLRRVEE